MSISMEMPDLLIIDDDQMFNWLANKICHLNFPKSKISNCINGKVAMDFLKEYQYNEKLLPDIIFWDLHMPELDGWTFLQEFQKIVPALGKDIRIYIISSVDNLFDKHFCLSFPFVKDIS